MIFQSPTDPGRVLHELAALLSDRRVERLRVAVAYANEGGVRALRTLLPDVPVEIVVTLDMGITRKAALRLLLRDFPGTVKAMTTPPGSGTFHTKAFVVDRTGARKRAIVGSANLTHAALTTNREAVSVGDLSDEEDSAWEAWWAELDASAVELTEAVIDGYTERFPPRGKREKIADVDLESRADGTVVVHEPRPVDARNADWLVIDWGGSGEYRLQFEIPRDAAAFFRGDRDATTEILLRHDGGEYRDNQLTFYADNGMWRINLDGDIPEVASGSIKRKASVFERRGEDDYELRVVDGAERARLLAEAAVAQRTGPRMDGSFREFGWR